MVIELFAIALLFGSIYSLPYLHRYNSKDQQDIIEPTVSTVIVKEKVPRGTIARQMDEVLCEGTTEWVLPIRELPVWFIQPWVSTIAISPAEQLIIDELQQYNIQWEREVSFKDLRLPTGGYPRYDFLLVDHKVIIEYDGVASHNEPHHKELDRIKTEFCLQNGITIVRWDRYDYYHIDKRIKALMKKLHIQESVTK